MLYNTLFILSYYYCLYVLICRIVSLKMLKRFHLCILNVSVFVWALQKHAGHRPESRPLSFFTSLLCAENSKNRIGQCFSMFLRLISSYVKAFHLICKANSCNPCTLMHACPELTYLNQPYQRGNFLSSQYCQTASCYETKKVFVSCQHGEFMHCNTLRKV